MTTVTSFPSGTPWTAYYHATSDSQWGASSYKTLGSFTNFEDLWGAMNSIKTKFNNGMFFFMKGAPKAGVEPPSWEKGNYPPLWEHKHNVYGGAYCVKVESPSPIDVFQHYLAAAVLGEVTTDETNPFIGVSISPKRGFSIMKLWNLSSDGHNNPKGIKQIAGIKTADILYRPHGDARM